MEIEQRFVTVFNGARDFYQVPIALLEHGQLTSHVGDYYRLPSLFASWAPKRENPALPASMVRSSPLAFLSQVAPRLVGRRPYYPFVDSVLDWRAAAEVRRTQSGVLAYAGYGYRALQAAKATGQTAAIFVYHPHPRTVRKILAADVAQYPEVAQSYSSEWEVRDPNARREGRLDAEIACADIILTASSFTAQSLEISTSATAIPYGHNPSAERCPDGGDRGCHFVFVGQGTQRKGLHHLVRAFRQLDGPCARLTLVVNNLDPGIAISIGDDSRVQVVSQLSANALAQTYRSAAVFVMPSLLEGFGLVYLEALSHGCHVVGTANTGLPDLGLSTNSVSLVEPGDIGELAQRLAMLHTSIHAREIDHPAISGEISPRTWGAFRVGISDALRSLK